MGEGSGAQRVSDRLMRLSRGRLARCIDSLSKGSRSVSGVQTPDRTGRCPGTGAPTMLVRALFIFLRETSPQAHANSSGYVRNIHKQVTLQPPQTLLQIQPMSREDSNRPNTQHRAACNAASPPSARRLRALRRRAADRTPCSHRRATATVPGFRTLLGAHLSFLT